jgi:hypothetical protein
MGPALVCTRSTAPELSRSKPRTSTPSTIVAPAARAFAARPCIDSLLKAKPPACSCRQTVSPFARQSGVQAAHMIEDGFLADVQLEGVADALLTFEDRLQVALLRRRPSAM